eukprot:maker-scaffold_3-augustus-gene-15.20-mRNA-1 protein AED:0.01 eAED:0.01 QI:138/1/1/1/0/0.5/2/163/821
MNQQQEQYYTDNFNQNYAYNQDQNYATAEGQGQGQYYAEGGENEEYEEFLSPFEEEEERNGVRFSWNEWPLSKVDAERIVVPLGCLYTPLKSIPDVPVVEYEPLRCKQGNCGAVLNPWAMTDLRTKLWTCPFCLARNPFPPHYAQNISETNLPAELLPDFTTIEYQLPLQKTHGPQGGVKDLSPAFIFVVDTCISLEELDELKDSIQQSLTILPETAKVGLITFGTMAFLHDLNPNRLSMHRSYVFKGSKEVTLNRISKILVSPDSSKTPSEIAKRFIAPVSEVGMLLDSILDDVRVDPWPVKSGERASRCTGTAISLAVSLLEKSCNRQGARIMLFVGGPPTIGPGIVSSKKLQEVMRSHTDIEKGKVPFMKAAKAFYKGLGDRMVTNCHTIDLFASSLDQIGVVEMREMIDSTGGLTVLADSFGQSVFKESFRRVFSRVVEEEPEEGAEVEEERYGDLTMGLGGTVEMITGREYKVRGAIGACKSLSKKSASVSDNPVGESGTYAWRVNHFGPETTLAFYFELAQAELKKSSQGQQRRHLQFITHYQHSSGRSRLRVTTVAGNWQQNPAASLKSLLPSFDQEAAAVLVSRVAVHRAETENTTDILRWLDRSLIRLCSKFANYTPDNPGSFQLPEEFSVYPQFMFHLRRSPFLQNFNSSPDEATYRRMVLMRECTKNSLIMIQATLMSYSFHGPPEPAVLDVSSIDANTILLLDTFFHVVVFHGETISSWRDQGYQNQPEYENFRDLLHAPREDAQALMEDRFPVPRYIVCDQHKSQSRFILAKLNPSVSNNPHSSQQVFTDDVSLKVFMESLMRLAVQS